VNSSQALIDILQSVGIIAIAIACLLNTQAIKRWTKR
jgi:hypothetical protein